MNLRSDCFEDGGALPECCAFGSFRDGKLRFGQNLNPDFRWTGLPTGTQSLALICDDLDVPVGLGQQAWLTGGSSGHHAVRSLCHWLLVDLEPEGGPIRMGEFSDGVFAGGKPGPDAPRGSRQGLNEFTEFFSRDSVLGGDYFGYDGPCPPPGSAPHRYVFTLYALNTPRLPLPRVFRKTEVIAALADHVLESALIMGLSSGRAERPAATRRADLSRPG